MAESGPYGITQFDAPGIIGAYQQAQQNRISMMVAQKQLDRMDKQAKDQEGVQKAVAAYIGSQESDQPVKTSPATPTASRAVPASPVPAAPVDPLAPLPDNPTTAAVPAQPTPHQPTAADREKLFNSLIAISPEVAGQYMDAFSKMDKAQLDHYNQTSQRIVQFAAGLMQLDPKQRQSALEHAAPEAQQLGIDPQHLADLDLSDQGLRQIIVSHMDAEKVAQFVQPDLMTVGHSVIDKNHPEKGAVYTEPTDLKTIMVKNADGSETPYSFDPSTGKASQLRDGGIPGAPSTGGPVDHDTLFNALIQQESGGRAGIKGPPTKYGTSTGLTQLLPSTAKQMADKLGVPWQPDLLTGTSPEAADYQRKLGRAYFEEGMAKYPNDVRSALMYYHGGPDQRLWGPKTHAYADSILKRVGGVQTGGDNLISGKPLPHDSSDDDTAKFIGSQVALGQPMPPLGMGKEAAAMRRAILAEATKQWKQMGISPGEANVIAAQNKSGLAELAKIAQMKATVQTAENTASANATQVLDLLGAAGTTGSPIFNKWQQAGRRATGDPKVSAFDVAVKTLSTEYARVMSGGGNTQLSDAARHEADALIHTDMTPDQFRAAIKQMKIDMENRTKGIEQERQATLQQIRTGGRGSAQSHDEGWTTLPSGLKVRRVQ